jgi:elongation factor P--beta-lysine ligase|tara:strand:+ start:205 stop:465 length:261 start_codon:yes stop_codon:yes gene_type:complete
MKKPLNLKRFNKKYFNLSFDELFQKVMELDSKTTEEHVVRQIFYENDLSAISNDTKERYLEMLNGIESSSDETKSKVDILIKSIIA